MSAAFEKDGKKESCRPSANKRDHAFRIEVERFATEYSPIEKYHRYFDRSQNDDL